MFKKRNSAAAPGVAPKKQRYWSVMLVGEHGRVIPFRHFKGIAIAVSALLVLSLLGIAAMGIVYLQKNRAVQHLQSELDDLREHAARLRDEKDILLAKLVIDQAQSPSGGRQAQDRTAGAGRTASAIAAPPTKSEQAGAPKAAAEPAPPPAPRVRWQADVRQFEVNHNQRQEMLEATFRVYNTTTPRQALSGDIVLVFTKEGDPTVAPLPLPAAAYRDGQPVPGSGQEFRINNYRTMRFRAERQKAPIAYDSVTVFVFESGGTRLLARQFDLDIPYTPPPGAERAPRPPVEEVSVDPTAPDTVSPPEGPSGEVSQESRPPYPPEMVGTGDDSEASGHPAAQMDSTAEGERQ